MAGKTRKFLGHTPNGRVVRVDADVWRELQLRATAFKDTPNSVLRQVLHIDEKDKKGFYKDTLFELVHTVIISRGKKRDAAMIEIVRRFKEFGWLSTDSTMNKEAQDVGTVRK